MKLTSKQLKKMICKTIDESRSDRRQPGNAPPGTFKKPERHMSSTDVEGTYVEQAPETKKAITDILGGDEALADSIMAAVRKMKEDGLI
jgi:hypothetical protein